MNIENLKWLQKLTTGGGPTSKKIRKDIQDILWCHNTFGTAENAATLLLGIVTGLVLTSGAIWGIRALLFQYSKECR